MRKVDKVKPEDSGIQTPDMGAMGGLGGMLGGLMGGSMPSVNLDDPNVIDGEATIDGEKVTIPNKDRFILTATPFNLSVAKSNNDKEVATLSYLCKDKDSKLFIVARNFIIDSEEDREIIATIPFAEDVDSDFASRIICNHMFMQNMDVYVADMNFKVDDDFNKNEDPIVHVEAIDIKSKDVINIDMTAEVFSCIAYIDSYVFEDLTNDHDLTLASVAASKETESPTTFFVVDSLEGIISMAPAVVPKTGIEKIKHLFSKETTSTVGVIAKFNRFISKDEKETATILCPLDVGKVYPDSKFKGKTIADIENTYFTDADQYVATLIVQNIRIFGVDKEYMMIRGKTKDKKVKIFLLDSAIKEQLEYKIEEF